MQVRQKVIALLATLTALWIFAAVVTLREGLNLLFVNTLGNSVGFPTEVLVNALQEERKLSSIVLGGVNRRDALIASRARTDEVAQAWREDISDLGIAATSRLNVALDEASGQLAKLSEYRAQVDNKSIDRGPAVAAYTAIIDAGFRIYGSISSLDDPEIAKLSRAQITMSRAREFLSQEDALLSGALAFNALSRDEVTRFTELVGVQRFLYDNASIDLATETRERYHEATLGPAMKSLRELESQAIGWVRTGTVQVPFTLEKWQNAIEPAAKVLRDVELAGAANTVKQATPVAVGVIVRLILAGGLGLLAVIAAIVISVTTTRSLVQQLEKLRAAARDLADNRLPQVVNRLSMGQEVDVASEAPPLSGFANDEIGQLGQAFNAVQETAIRAAVQQAELRRGVRDVFLSLARRTQNLVHKQLGLLDTMERRADPDEMEDLFRIDHLATRMRRSAENLIILSGATPGRMWRRPVSMIDVVRGALGEVEDYTRVNLLPIDEGALTGRAVGDVIHLLAELIENAVSYSPPYTGVNVSGQSVANGFVIEVEDRGLGMSDEDLRAANTQLAEPPDFSLADASKLGHYVVSKLAQRHGIKVHLRHSPYGGTAAIVLIPSDLIVKTDDSMPALPAGENRVPASVSYQPRPALTSLPSREHGRESGREPGRTGALPQRVLSAGSTALVSGTPATGVEAPSGTAEDSLLTTTASGTTPSGLPWRVRQASLAPQLRDDSGDSGESDEAEEQPARDPETIRRMMRSYQHGTARGRSEAINETDSIGVPEQPQPDRPDAGTHGEAGGDAGRHVAKEHLGDRQEG